jgi:excinuclease UvrABC nuclease subunit
MEASLEDLSAVVGMSQTLAERVKRPLHSTQS